MTNDVPDRIWPVGGYAPGDYWTWCITCEGRFMGDKRAYTCPDCTIQALRTPAREHAEELVEAAEALIQIVEGIKGAMNHGTWRAERSNLRMKDTDEWVQFYNVTKSLLARIEQETT